jgi:hypothetical protein
LKRPILREYYLNGGTLRYVPVNNLSPSTTQFSPNDNGQGNEMELIFERADLENPNNIAEPCPNATPAPSPSATPLPSSPRGRSI